jgi:hypothetical protein
LTVKGLPYDTVSPTRYAYSADSLPGSDGGAALKPAGKSSLRSASRERSTSGSAIADEDAVGALSVVADSDLVVDVPKAAVDDSRSVVDVEQPASARIVVNNVSNAVVLGHNRRLSTIALP